MSLPSIKGIQPPPIQDLAAFEQKYPELGKWFRLLTGAMAKINTYSAELTPASVAANSESLQAFTVTGLKTNDVVTVNKPTDTANISISLVYVSATDTLAIKFRNHSGGAIVPPAETYRVVSVRL